MDAGWGLWGRQQLCVPVSYTHLDVYKRQTSAYERIASLGWTEAQIQLRYLGIAADEADQFQTCLLYTSRCV